MVKATFAITMALLAGTLNVYAIAEHDFSSGTAAGGTGWSSVWEIGSSGERRGYVSVNGSSPPLVGKCSNMGGIGYSSTTGMYRDYTAGIDALSNEHTISFLVRIDTLNTNATGDLSHAIVTHGGITYELGINTSWALYVQDGTFHYYNGDGTGSSSGAATDSGVAVTEDTVYSVKIVNRIGADSTGPTTGGEYDLLVTADGSSVLSLTNLEYRRTTAPEAGFIGLGLAGSNWTSYDQVFIVDKLAPITVENAPAGLILTWDSVSGLDYEVQYTADLEGTWDMYTNLAGNGSTMTVTTAVNNVETFYRVISEL